MKIIDQEGDIIVDLVDVKSQKELDKLIKKEYDLGLEDIVELAEDTPFFAMSLEKYEKMYGEKFDEEDIEIQEMTFEEWWKGINDWACEFI
jgi:hypothetical protein